MISAPFHNPPPEQIRALLEAVQSVAVVGLSPKPKRPSHVVAKALQGFGYRVIPVRPATDEVLGERAWPDLRALPEVPDLVDVFCAPDRVGPIVDACIELGVKRLWLQEGVVNEVQAQRAVAAGIEVVMDRCIYKYHQQLMG